jgi:hypothetical protein
MVGLIASRYLSIPDIPIEKSNGGYQSPQSKIVIPAKAGIHTARRWIPAFAGMTDWNGIPNSG